MGAVVGELVLGRKIGWRGAAWGLFFGTLPDLDVLVMPFLDEVDKIRWHRGISHSILMMFVGALVFAKPLAWLHRERGVGVGRAGWFVFLAWSTHVLIDVFTTYGTQIYEPFSDERVSFGNLFIIDPIFTLPLLWCVWSVLCRCIGVWQGELETTAVRSSAAYQALGVAGAYVAFSFGMKEWAGGKMEERVAAEFESGEVVSVAPTPFNTVLWRGMVETEDGYWVTYWSPFDEEPGKFDFYAKHHELAERFEGEEMFENLKWFAQDDWVARRGEEGKVVFVNMRFGEMRNREMQQQLPMFQWHLWYDENGDFQAPSYRPRDLDIGGALLLLWDRVRGETTEWEGMKRF